MDEVLFMLHMKLLRNSLTAVTLFLLSAALNAAETTAPKADKYKQTPEMATISRAAAYLIANSHFNQQQLNEKISSQLFDDYFKALDPTRMFFTAEDIKSFEPQKKQLGTQIRMGNVQFAFDVFKLFVKRLEEYEKFTAEYLKKKPDLTANEDFDVNRSKAPWAANRAELEQLWIKKTKNDLILLNLMELAKKEDAKKAAKPEKAVAGKDRTQEKDAKAAGESVAAKTAVKLPPPSTPEERTLKRVDQFVQFYKNMEAVDILEVYLSSLTRIYDPHSEYMSPRTEEDFNIGMKLSLVGIGALLTNEDGYTKIVKIIPGGPADVDGRLKAEDKIIAVAQENSDPVDILDMPVSKVVEHIRGKENTKVSLTVLDGSKGAGAVPTVITLKREKVRLKESEASGKVHEITQNGKKLRIGVITLPSFYIDFEAAWRGDRNYKSSTRDVVNLIREFTAKAPLDGLVMDLRSNGGGSLLEAVTLTGLFIKDGPVVQVKDIKGKSVDEDNDGGKILYGGPLAVLTNRFSASATEIFAGAIKDHQRGIILGDSKTHGKGTVQRVIELEKYTAFLGAKIPVGSIKLTSAKFYRINGESTQLKGVTPDIVYPSFSDTMDIGEEKLPHAMAWDTIQPLNYNVFDPNLPALIPVLKERSEHRIRNNPEFTLLKKDIEAFRKIRDRKTVSLNLEKRWQEYLSEKKLHDEQEKLMRLDMGSNSDASKKEIKDLYLDETLNVVADYISMNGKPVNAMATAK